MNCEFCKRKIRNGELVHGIRYGTADGYNQAFLPARDSAWTVICEQCGEMLYKIIYAKLRTTSTNPTLHKTFTQTR